MTTARVPVAVDLVRRDRKHQAEQRASVQESLLLGGRPRVLAIIGKLARLPIVHDRVGVPERAAASVCE